MRKIKLDIQLFAGGTIPGTDTAKYCIMQVVWSATASDAVTNKSSVTASVQVRKTNSVGSTGTFSGSVTINGTTTSISKKFSPLGSSWKTVGSATIDVPHNSDGSKVCNIQAYLKQTGTTDMGGTYTADEDVTLDRILRGSVLDNFTSTNTAASYGFTKYVAGFYDVITFTSNGKTLATALNPASAAGEYHYSISYDLSQVLAAATAAGNRTITVTATLRTYTDSSTTTQVGDAVAKTYNITLGSDTLNNISSLSISNAGAATFIPTFSKWTTGTYDNIIVTGSNFSQTFYGVSSGSTYTLNNTNLFNAMGTNTSISLQFNLVSYSSSSGAYLGESAGTYTISLPAYNITASVNSFIDQTTTPSGMSDNISTFKKTTNTMIRYLSNPLITYKVGTSTGYLYGRTISTSGARVVTGLVHNSTFTVEPGTNMSATYTINATDGRKPAATATQSFIVVPYFTPTLSVRFERTAPTATTATATITATYYNDTGNLLQNKKTLSTINTAILTYTETGGTAVVKSYSDTTPTSSTSGNATTLIFTYNITGLDYQKSIAVSAQFKDLIGYTVISNVTIPNGLPAINVFRLNDKNHAKVNGNLDVDGNLNIIQNVAQIQHNGTNFIGNLADGRTIIGANNGTIYIRPKAYNDATKGLMIMVDGNMIYDGNLQIAGGLKSYTNGDADVKVKGSTGHELTMYSNSAGSVGLYDFSYGDILSVDNNGTKHLGGNWYVDGSIKSKNLCVCQFGGSTTFSATWTYYKLPLQAVDYNNAGFIISSSSFYVPANVSVVKVQFAISYYAIDNPSDKNFVLYKNNTQITSLAYVNNGSGAYYCNASGMAVVSVAQGDALSVWCSSGTAGNMRIFGSSSRMSVEIIA